MADRVRRVSFLVDLGAGTAEERAQVRLVLSRVLTHLSRQSPAPPRWSFRFYDSSLTPQRFDARMHARAKASSAVDPKLGAAASLRRDEFHACTPDAIAAVLRQYDQAVELYNAADAEGANHVGTPPEHPGDPVDGPDSAERTGWFTTLARQMAGVIQRAAGELAGMTGDGDGGESERRHSAVVILARVRGDAPARSNDENDPTARPPPVAAPTEVDFLRPFKGIEDAYRKENTRAYLLRLGARGDTRAAATAETTRRASELFARFGGSSAPVAAVAHAASPGGCLPPGLLMSAFANVKRSTDDGTTPSERTSGPPLPLGGSFVRRGGALRRGALGAKRRELVRGRRKEELGRVFIVIRRAPRRDRRRRVRRRRTDARWTSRLLEDQARHDRVARVRRPARRVLGDGGTGPRERCRRRRGVRDVHRGGGEGIGGVRARRAPRDSTRGGDRRARGGSGSRGGEGRGGRRRRGKPDRGWGGGWGGGGGVGDAGDRRDDGGWRRRRKERRSKRSVGERSPRRAAAALAGDDVARPRGAGGGGRADHPGPGRRRVRRGIRRGHPTPTWTR